MRRLHGADPVTPLNRTTQLVGVHRDAKPDAHEVIVLVALACAILGALGLHSAIQCALRCCCGRGEEATRLTKKVLRRIPVAEYGGGVPPTSTSECSICLAEFAYGERVRVLPQCNHGFHVLCIDTWLVAHPSCPMCRRSLLASPPELGRESQPSPIAPGQ